MEQRCECKCSQQNLHESEESIECEYDESYGGKELPDYAFGAGAASVQPAPIP